MYHDDGTDKAFIDYDPKKDTRKYHVYRNDIKYKKHRKIDPDRAIWENEQVKKDFFKETDAIRYRLEECKKEKYETLDLSHMDKKCLKQLFKSEEFPLIKNKLQHLFVKDCGLRKLPDLSELTSLMTLDVSCNKIKTINVLPKTLEELIVNDNRLTKIENDLPNLKRINANNNMIDHFNCSNSLESINIKNNPIDRIPSLNNLYHLDIASTKITLINSFPSLKLLDCSRTAVEKIPKLDKLDVLICNSSSVSDISALTNLKGLEMINCKISQIHYMKNLHSVVYHTDNDSVKLSQYYRILRVTKNKKNLTEITFDIPK